jgi:peroxiredoxin
MNAPSTAPELAPDLDWINAPSQTLRALRGRVVVLGFWNAGSAICQNLLDDLRFVQGKHADGVTVLGIHTPKFEAERNARLVQKAINRHSVRFPVANDPAFITWQHYGIRAWPSVVLLDAQGRVVEVGSGDMKREALDQRITQLLDEAGARDQRVYENAQPVLKPEPRVPLSFPSGIAVTANHVYIADTGHHRILECTHEGRILRQFGSGNGGFLDGGSAEASLQSPRGLALHKDMLYVADTGNHALRRVRLLDGDIDTLAGSGHPGLPSGVLGGNAADLPLNSPWGVAAGFDRVFIGMSALQQIWEYDLAKRSLRAVAGSGRLGLVDGTGTGAAFGQPAGLALVQQTLYVADSAASAIRSVHLGSGGVQTLVGQGLYDFGDQDGTRSAARLQYPLGLALDPRSPLLWIADSYNDSLRMLRLGGGDLRRYEIDYRLQQPGAIAASPGALWVANTNAHEVVRIDLDANTVRRLPVGE